MLPTASAKMMAMLENPMVVTSNSGAGRKSGVRYPFVWTTKTAWDMSQCSRTEMIIRGIEYRYGNERM